MSPNCLPRIKIGMRPCDHLAINIISQPQLACSLLERQLEKVVHLSINSLPVPRFFQFYLQMSCGPKANIAKPHFSTYTIRTLSYLLTGLTESTTQFVLQMVGIIYQCDIIWYTSEKQRSVINWALYQYPTDIIKANQDVLITVFIVLP